MSRHYFKNCLSPFPSPAFGAISQAGAGLALCAPRQAGSAGEAGPPPPFPGCQEKPIWVPQPTQPANFSLIVQHFYCFRQGVLRKVKICEKIHTKKICLENNSSLSAPRA